MILEDGAGTGRKAQVTLANQLRVRSSSTHLMSTRGYERMAFLATTPLLAIGTDTNRVFWFRNNRATHHVHIDKLWLMWNGGNTNKNRACISTMFLHDGVPDGNFVEAPVGNLWIGDQTPLDLQLRFWNGTGTGMTFSGSDEGGGAQGATTIAAQGHTILESHAMILPYGVSVGFKIYGEEAGVATAMLSGYLCSEES